MLDLNFKNLVLKLKQLQKGISTTESLRWSRDYFSENVKEALGKEISNEDFVQIEKLTRDNLDELKEVADRKKNKGAKKSMKAYRRVSDYLNEKGFTEHVETLTNAFIKLSLRSIRDEAVIENDLQYCPMLVSRFKNANSEEPKVKDIPDPDGEKNKVRSLRYLKGKLYGKEASSEEENKGPELKKPPVIIRKKGSSEGAVNPLPIESPKNEVDEELELPEEEDIEEELPTIEEIEAALTFADQVTDQRSLIEQLEKLERELRGRASPEYTKRIRSIVRNPKIARLIKEKEGYRCAICGVQGFEKKKKGPLYAEAHHVDELATCRRDLPSNMLCVCPTCHRILHHGSEDALKKRRAMKK